MNGVFGLDPQFTRTGLALAEGPRGGLSSTRQIGDGRRRLIPNACESGDWGSLAAERRLARIDERSAGALVPHLLTWRRDPLDPACLTGIGHRVRAYVGVTAQTPLEHYRLCLAGHEPLSAAAAAAITGAGLPAPIRVHPAEALVHRWIGDLPPGAAADTTVVAVACGETQIATGRYRVERSKQRPRVTVLDSACAEGGAWAVSAALARRVLLNCKQGVPPVMLLALLDGCAEFAAMLRALPPDRVATWDGPFADRMFTALGLSRAAMAQWDEVVALTRAVRDAIRPLAAGADTPIVLVGGMGAIWPCVAEAAREFGQVWISDDPGADIAIGAAWSALGSSVEPRTSSAPPASVPDPPVRRAGTESTPPWLH
ncbi:hypothetical protein [Nocardia sp. alder85J]|uniref:hypothetical protein n=1 Tax=Nocardia sp. alder85J TaxID=2862949 RepID=UPI001CD31733|nr:hypothetical protein [Nocardia sp. alder85J]MCX4092346.1 hypothetical protein [Nocardia sp. alder85J]